MIKLFENYTVTTDGRVINDKTGYELQGELNNAGYRRVAIAKKRYFVHRLVAMTYIPNPHGKEQVNHKDGCKINNDVSNLEWNTPSENQQHSHLYLKRNTGKGVTRGGKPFQLLGPDNELIEGVSLRNFCLQNKLNHSSMRRMMRGERTHYHGYKKY